MIDWSSLNLTKLPFSFNISQANKLLVSLFDIEIECQNGPDFLYEKDTNEVDDLLK